VNLIGSDKVEGTAVYGPDGTKIGSIERVMIDKLNGKVSYAVLSFGGFLGIGDDYYPLPWQSLKYDTNLGGYVTGITEAQLKNAPKYSNDNAWNWAMQRKLGQKRLLRYRDVAFGGTFSS
jgi:sporulation protein YlmC with PRC-barrel domain